jgi:tetratricopeptide (TPR) repeat protein
LLRELRWYLETFLDYPFPPETDRAERVLQSLKQWGEQAFNALFGSRAAGRMFEAATSKDYSQLHLQVSSDDARILAWPWEALRDPELGYLAHTCQIARRLHKLRGPQPIPASLPRNQLSILLVVARPYQRDVGYRSIARPLVELIEKQKLPVYVHLLRPPTFGQLRQHLHAWPGNYHILHFDGHGAYSSQSPGNDLGYVPSGPEGKLVFETDDGGADEVNAEQLSPLLGECAVPGVVLNACPAAMLDERGADPFASVAAALLRAGMRSVVAMAYSLYVSGAQQFLPAFYGRLFENGSVAEAVRAGRQQMLARPDRVSARGKFPLHDWLLPVLYEQEPLDFSFAVRARKSFEPRPSKLPDELKRELSPYRFIGRDGPLLDLERALRRPPAGILIQGLDGVGKTTLARGFLRWLDSTEGLGEGCFWFSFPQIRSAEYVFNRLGEAICGPQFATETTEKKLNELGQKLRERRYLIVWDSFESASGIPGAVVTANLSESDRQLLALFLDKVRAGVSKVIITSRSREDWLTPQRCALLRLGGLEGEERWEFCEAIVKALGLRINREDKEVVELMKLLGGHPLAMRAILPQLERFSAAQVAVALRSNLSQLKLGGEEEQGIYATLRFVEQSLPRELKPLLVPLAMHEGFADADYLERMASQVKGKWKRAKIDELVEALVAAGLLRAVTQATYEVHPVLTGYLRWSFLRNPPLMIKDSWARAFVNVMGQLADQLAPLEPQQQRVPFQLHAANFYGALSEAERLGMNDPFAALAQSLAAYALDTRTYATAASLIERLAEHARHLDHPEGEAAACHQLGTIAQKQRDFAAAEAWYHRSLAISEKQGEERIAARSYHQLGTIAEGKRDSAAAETWYRKSLAITEKLGDEYAAASSYHQLGGIAQERHDFAAAETWYRKSLASRERLHDENGAASTYYQLGMIAQEQSHLAAADAWYRKSLAIKERLHDENGAASTYHQLARIAQERRDFAAAEVWYRKSLAIKEKQGSEQGAAMTCQALGLLAGQQQHFIDGGQWLIKAILGFRRAADPHNVRQAAERFLVTYWNAPPADQAQLETLWNEAGLGPFPKPSA